MTVQETDAPAVEIPGVSPYLQMADARAAAEFYVRAFGAMEVDRRPTGDGRLMHCGMMINGGLVMFCDSFPEYGSPFREPQGFVIHLQVRDIDAWWTRAVEAGCETVMPLELQFWGDRYGQVKDPFGIVWSMGETPA